MLEVTDLSKTYRGKGTEDVQALNGASFTPPDTGMVLIPGKSGSDKSTLLNLLGGLDAKTGKEILLLLKELSREKLVIVVSQDAEFAHTFGGRILEIADGAIVRDNAV